jgi:uncharacterized membrane protein YfhO
MNAAVGGSIFLATMALVFRYLAMYGKSVVWRVDGFFEHFPGLYFVNTWLRGLLAHPTGGLPLWSWHLGLGADVIGTLAPFTVGDPFVLLTLFFPMRQMEAAYLFIFFARIVCAGLFSALYFRKMGGRWLATTAGSLVYVFATYLFSAGLHHPYFIDALVFLPLLLLGVEDVLRTKRPYALVGAVFVAALCNFYFFYMQAIVTVIYAVVRYIELTPKGERIRRLPVDGGRAAGSFLLGCMLASPVMLPALEAFFTSSRAGTHEPFGLLYSLHRYGSMLVHLSSPGAATGSSYLGFSPVAFVLLPILFMRRGNATIKWMTGLLAAFIALPFFGFVFNGFNFPSNRFAFAWGSFLACATVLVFSDDRPPSRRELLASGAVCAAFAGVWALGRFSGQVTRPARLAVPFAIAVAAWSLLAFWGWRARRTPSRADVPARRGPLADWSESLVLWGLLAVIILGIGANAALAYDHRFSSQLGQWLDRGTVLARYSQQKQGLLAASISDPSFFRVDKQLYVQRGANLSTKSNDALVQGYPGTTIEYSVTSAGIMKFMKEIENRSVWLSFGYTGFDDRAILDALIGEKYLVGSPDLKEYVPYGFSAIETSGDATVLRNAWALPLGFVYDAAIPRSAYERLDALGKQSALLEGAVVDDAIAASMPSVAPSLAVIDVPYSVESSSGVLLDRARHRLVVERDNGTMTLRFPPVPDAELYVEIRNPTYAAYKKHPLKDPRVFYQVAGDHAFKKAARLLPKDVYYWPDDSMLVNLGYRPRGASAVTLRFRYAEVAKFTDLRVLALPMRDFPARIAHLRDRGLRDIVVGTDRVSGSVDTTTGGLLFLSIPYSAGWSATVDGVRTPVVRADTAFSGVPVTAGRHRVVLRYFTPWLPAGLFMWALGVLALGAIIVHDARARRRVVSP